MSNAELWDLLDHEGQRTGEVFRKGAHRWPAGRLHLVVATCVVCPDGRLLMTRRAAAKEYPLTWELPGGSALAGESSVQAAVRELREETGLVVPESGLQRVGCYTEGVALVDLFVTAAPGRPALTLLADEIDDAKWVTVAEASSPRTAGEMAPYWTDHLEDLWPTMVTAAASVRLA